MTRILVINEYHSLRLRMSGNGSLPGWKRYSLHVGIFTTRIFTTRILAINKMGVIPFLAAPHVRERLTACMEALEQIQRQYPDWALVPVAMPNAPAVLNAFDLIHLTLVHNAHGGDASSRAFVLDLKRKEIGGVAAVLKKNPHHHVSCILDGQVVLNHSCRHAVDCGFVLK